MNVMSPPEQQSPSVKLSICITTFNRAGFIGATLDSILKQLGEGCEVVVVDGASSDNTEDIVFQYARRFDNVRYFRQSINQGIDRDYDRAAQLACGEYCWFMTDDDLLKPGAIAKVQAELRHDVSVLLVNYQRLDVSMSSVVLERALDIHTDARYGSAELDRLFSDTRRLLVYIGCLIIKRSLWMSRNRERYYDTALMHIAVIFQERLPGDALVVAEPLIGYRDGNPRTFWRRIFEIFLVKYPEAVSSFAISENAKTKYLEDTRNSTSLLFYRAMGWYCFDDYRRWILPNMSPIRKGILPILIAVTPGVIAHVLCTLAQSLRKDRLRSLWLLHLRMSPYHFLNLRFLGHRKD